MKKNIFIFSFFCLFMLIPARVLASTDLSVELSEGTAFTNINSNITEYNVTIFGGTFSITSVITTNATVTYSPSQSINIGYGETKPIIITVTDNTTGEKKDYTINATRIDNRSEDNTLKVLTIDNTDIKFNGSTSYSATVKNEVKEVKINATPAGANVVVEGTGIKELKEGINTFEVVVSAKNNNKKTYTVNITREKAEIKKTTEPNPKQETTNLSGNNYLKSLTIDKISDFKFSKDIIDYNIGVSNDVKAIKINYEPEDEKATVVVTGNTKLSVGENKIIVAVTAPNKEIRRYTLSITQEKKEEVIDNETQAILDALDKDDTIITIKGKLNSKNTKIDSRIIEKLKETKKILVYEINNSAGGLLYSATFKGSNITNKITSLNYGLTFTSKNKEKIEKLTNGYSILDLNFTHSGELPKDTDFKIYVGNRYNNEKLIYLYKYNEEKNKLELVQSNIKSINEYVTLSLDHCSEYVLSNEKITYTNNAIIVILIITFLILLIFGLIYAIIRKKNKNNTDGFGLQLQDDINVFNPLVDNNVENTPKEEEVEIVDLD